MRLTLRTLLAYRDGVLSNAQTSDLHKRIQQSELASNLLRRIEASLQRGLMTPSLHGSGIAGDANLVAEYLDDTIHGDKVPEFERICISESEAHLAELAHCHQLMAEALNAQVSVPAEFKSKILSMVDPATRDEIAKQIGTEVKAEAIVDRKKIDAMPLEEGKIRRLDKGHLESKNGKVVGGEADPTALSSKKAILQNPQVQAPMVSSGGGTIKPQGLDLESSQLAREVPEYLAGSGRDGWRLPLAIGAMVALLGLLIWQALGPLEHVRELLALNETPVQKPAAEAVPVIAVPVIADPESSKEPQAKIAEVDSANVATPNAEDIEREFPPSPDNIAALSKADVTNPAVPPATESDVVPDKPAPPATEVAAGEVNQLMSLTLLPREGSQAVVFVTSTAEGKPTEVARVAPATAIPMNSEIVVPPAMNATLDLGGKASWQTCGPSKLRIGIDEQLATVQTTLCRAIVQNGPHGNQIAVRTPAGDCTIKFADATSMVAIEVGHRQIASGTLVDNRAYAPVLIVVGVEGSATVMANSADPAERERKLAIGDGLAWVAGMHRKFKLGEIPSWYRHSADRAIDWQASKDLDQLVAPGANARELLEKLCLHRRPETGALSQQINLMVGNWDSFMPFLGTENMRSHWDRTLGLANVLLASDLDQAKRLQKTLMTETSSVGADLFQLIIGVPEDQQPADFLPNLIAKLDGQEMSERVLAAYQLKKLTGKDHGFQPAQPNRASVQQWRRDLATNHIQLLPIGDPIYEAKK